jgi:hypothetical protein
MHRVYFNRKADYPLVWSVDEGTQETEQTVREVNFRGTYGVTAMGKGDNENSPTVWIAVYGATLYVQDDIAYLMGVQP